MKKEIFCLVKRIVLFFSPFLFALLFLVLLYVILDPFKVLKEYDSYYISDEESGVTLNKNWISTKTFEKNYDLYRYDSFIFGNSRSIFYEVADWEPHIDPGSSCFHFDASGEGLYALNKKIQYLNSKNVAINNVLMIIDYSTLEQTASQTTHIGIIAPQLENNRNLLNFHFTSLKAFLTPKFMLAFVDYKIRGEVKPYMKKGFLLDDLPIHYVVKTNEVSFPHFERLIEEGKYYTPERMKIFYERDTTQQTYSPPVIFDAQKQMLQEINDIFRKHNTDFKIIISPLYDQIKLNESDLAYLRSLFGNDRVFDFAGISDITNNIHNYYEDSHYRPHVTRKMLESMYRKTE